MTNRISEKKSSEFTPKPEKQQSREGSLIGRTVADVTKDESYLNISEKVENIFEKQGVKKIKKEESTKEIKVVTEKKEVKIIEIDDSTRFHAAIVAAKNCLLEEEQKDKTFLTKDSKHFGAFVHAYPVKEYALPKKFVTEDDSAGMIVKKNGDIASVFKHPTNCKIRGVLTDLIPRAIKAGGNHLDCFNGSLPGMYSACGFIPVAKVKFDPQYAPEHWNKERDGEPDIIFMVYDEKVAGAHSIEEVGKRDTRIDTMITQLSYSNSYEAGAEKQLKSV